MNNDFYLNILIEIRISKSY